MYRMIVVDDKEDIIQGIQAMGQWDDIGIVISGCAHDGQEALKLIEKNEPHIVITDIKMPIMDGLQLTESIKRMSPEIKVVILSGYDEFQFAQQALKLGAEEYLLKPIRIHQLKEVILRVIRKLDEELARKEEEAKLLERLQQSLPLLRNKYFQQLLVEPAGIHEEEVARRLNFLEVNLYSHHLAVILVEIDHYHGIIDPDSYQQSEWLHREIEELEHNFNLENVKIAVFTDTSERMGWIVSVPSLNNLPEINQNIFALAEKINLLAEKKENISLSIGIGRFYSGFSQLFHSYQDAVEALTHKFLLGSNQIIHIDDVLPDQKLSFIYPVEIEKKLLLNLKTGAYQETEHLLENYFEVLDHYTYSSPKFIKKSLMGFILSLSRVLLELNIDEESVTENNDDLLTQITKFDTLDEIKKWIRKIVVKINLISSSEKKHKAKVKMERAKEYIAQHIADEISLNAVAHYIDLSPNYFTTLFKEYTRETFMDYVIKIRIEKARELIQTGRYKVYEVANRVGYYDARYFSEIFKKYVGVTPADYLKK